MPPNPWEALTPLANETKQKFIKRLQSVGASLAQAQALADQFFHQAAGAGAAVVDTVTGAASAAGGGAGHPAMDIHLSGGMGDHVPLAATLGGGDKALAATLGGGEKALAATLGGGQKALEANLGGGARPLAAELGVTAALGGTTKPILLGPFSLHLGDFKLAQDVKFTLKLMDDVPILSLTIKGTQTSDQAPN